MLSWLSDKSARSAEVSELKDIVSQSWKRLRQDNDLLTEKQKNQFAREIQSAQNAATAQAADLAGARDALVEKYNRIFPPKSGMFWRENGEVLIVALIVAMAVRAFFLQPFKIPTGSMQPTLNGITVRAITPTDRTLWYRMVCRLLFGERIIRFVAEEDGTLDTRSIHTVRYGPFHFGGSRGFFNILPAEGAEFYVGGVKYVYPAADYQFMGDVLNNPELRQPISERDHYFHKGDVMLECVVKTGDQLFVDRFTYHFVKPKRGDVFVFDTHGLPVGNPGEFYIKRLAGLPDDTLRIADSKLYVNGELAHEPGFQRVMSMKDGYHGYTSNVPRQQLLTSSDESFKLPPGEYMALGDNSRSSSDSRVWGPLPYEKIVGRGFFVYWPFTSHFGRVP